MTEHQKETAIKKPRGKKKQPTLNELPAPTNEPTREEITAAAHALWEQEGCPEGRDLEHWLKAENQLRQGRARGAAPDGSALGPAA